jgi:hypothetical protein
VVLAARYDASGSIGMVRAMGRVIAREPQLEIEWRCTQFDVHPSAQGQRQWRKEHFCFDVAVAQRYGLPDRAARQFPDAPGARPGKTGTEVAGPVRTWATSK